MKRRGAPTRLIPNAARSKPQPGKQATAVMSTRGKRRKNAVCSDLSTGIIGRL